MKVRESGYPDEKIENHFLMSIKFLRNFNNKGGQVKICGTCADTRGIKNLPLIEGAKLSTMA